MGQEVNRTEFSTQEEQKFYQKLRTETSILKKWFDNQEFGQNPPMCGLELEAWLTTPDYIPSPTSDQFVQEIDHDLVVPEISKYNFELNSDPILFEGKVFSEIEKNLNDLWNKCSDYAKKQDLNTVIIGSLPTLRDYMLDMQYLSPQTRYMALNNNVMKLREGAPVKLEIEGRDNLYCTHNDVITECAATSLQIHYGLSLENSVSIYNASVVGSAFMAAISANSPFLFGQQLWDETRIPIFEQSVNLKSYRKKSGEYAKRVGLGNRYVEKSIFEVFLDNLDGYPILLYEEFDSAPEDLAHFKLHNGTIWRWNRPLIGIDKDGKPSLRIEFRVPSAGPTIVDSIANTVFQIGMVEYLSSIVDLTKKIPFEVAEENFYLACKHGLEAEITWLEGEKIKISDLMINQVIPATIQSLKEKNIDKADINKYVQEIILGRVCSSQNGASWQKQFVLNKGVRFQELMEKYHYYQKQNLPVHQWSNL